MSTTATTTKWIGRRELEDMLRDAGMPCSRPTVERLMSDEASGFPQPRRISEHSRRLWDRALVEAWIVRSRCSDLTPGEGAAA